MVADPSRSAPPRLVGVGVGPGDPELVTVRAVRELAGADVILVPATERSGEGPGRAEQIVTGCCPQAAGAVRRVPFSMADRQGVTARRQEAWETSAGIALEAFAAGASSVVLATVGDPSVYSTFSYLAAHVTARRPEVGVEVVPGITAMQALAAASRVPLAEGSEVLALVPVTAGMDTLERALEVADTVVAYKGGRQLPEVLTRLRAADRVAGTVLGTDVSLPVEQLTRLEDWAEGERAPYFSTILAPARRTGVGGRL